MSATVRQVGKLAEVLGFGRRPPRGRLRTRAPDRGLDAIHKSRAARHDGPAANEVRPTRAGHPRQRRPLPSPTRERGARRYRVQGTFPQFQGRAYMTQAPSTVIFLSPFLFIRAIAASTEQCRQKLPAFPSERAQCLRVLLRESHELARS